MGGMFGIGGNSADTDRGNQLAATQGAWNIFNYGLPTAKTSEAAGQADLGDASSYFKNLLKAGRTDTALRSAPAINAAEAQADAVRRREASMGTGRTGGTAELNREAGAGTQANIDNIINENLMGGRKEAAAGLMNTGSLELGNAASMLGLASGADEGILKNATASREVSAKLHDQAVQGYGEAFGTILRGLMGFG